jgi:hypothetical protein
VTLSRSFKVALFISAVTHAGVFALLDREPIAQKLLAAPKALVAKRPKPKVVRFELVDTPASAESPEPPKKSSLVSNKNTRAQDRFKGEKKREDSPHLEGKRSDSKDTRPKAVIAKPSPPANAAPKPKPKPEAKPKPKPEPKPKPKPEPKPEPKAEPKTKPEPKIDIVEKGKDIKPKEATRKKPAKREKELLQQVLPEKKPSKPAEPERKEKEVIRLAKKSPAEIAPIAPVPTIAPPAQASSPKIFTSVDAGNMGGDALIEGEISFGATRHFFGDYLLKMKQAVETEWMSLLVSRYSGVRRSSAAIDFKIQPDGRVTDIEIKSNEGDPYFPLVCISSIQSAEPFDEIRYTEIQGLPEEFIDKALSVRFTFRYN